MKGWPTQGVGLIALVATVATVATADGESPEVTAVGDDLLAAALAPEAGGMTAAQAAKMALARDPAVGAASADISATRARNSQTLATYVPRVALVAGLLRNNAIDFNFSGGGFGVGALAEGPLTVGTCTDGVSMNCVLDSDGNLVGAFASQPFQIPLTNYSLEASISIPLTDYVLKLAPARRASRKDIAAATSRRDAAKRASELDARVAFYQWVRAVAQVAVAKESLRSAQSQLADARVLLAGGNLVPADVLQSESVEATAKIAIAQAESAELISRHALARMVGVSADELRIGEDIGEALESLEHYGGLDELVAKALAQRDEIRALDAAVKAADEAAIGLGRERLPRIDATGSVLHANPNSRFFPPSPEWNTSWTVGLSASWALDRFFLARGRTNEMRATELRLGSELEQMRRAVANEVTAAYADARRIEVAIGLSAQDLAAARAAFEQRQLLYRAGEATTSQVVEAELQRTNATLRAVGLRIDARIARARLMRAVGEISAPRGQQ